MLKSLPRNLGETFDRAMKRILKRGYAKTAGRIFRWIAAVRRALTLDELREALSYEPGTPYSIAGKRPNGLERIATWCENLVQLDDELKLVQFAHHSVLLHFLEQPSELSFQSFQINLEDVDHFVGEICVTYLNSNEFKTDLIRNPPALPTQFTDYIIDKTLESGGVTRRMMGIMQRPRSESQQRLTKNKESMIMIKTTLEDSEATLHSGHPFLKYALDHWLPHTRNFEKGKSITWNLWKQMVRGSHGLARTPWSPSQFHDQASVVYEWLDQHDHLAVFLQFLSITEMSSKEIFRLVYQYAKLGRLNYLNPLVSSISDKEELGRELILAAEGGHLEVVQTLLDTKADVNAKLVNGQTALHEAACNGHLEVVQTLLDAKADVNAKLANGQTALHEAACNGHLEVVQTLLDTKADVNAKLANGWTALHEAVYKGNVEIVQTLLDAKADVNAAMGDGLTALYRATFNGHLEVVQILLDAKADVNAKLVVNGRTALYEAARNGHLEIVQTLLDAKANFDATTTEDGWTALKAATEGDYPEIVALLKSFGAEE